ncbi:ECF transporter S component [Falsibacillus albus]|uniref:ECF transporter S component n=1 Tax=Falsibacillus albus TaxID=2478915 RepID=A0A3L7K2K3_9BACI|nr:ECF transporter S component [Falsibacillus albus]RLQ96211.1 ECF transporter S component [Falsibacillus albus]
MLAFFVAISAIGAFIKIPSGVGSVALDSAPAMVAGVLASTWSGGIAAAGGHILSAMLSGFPLGPLHVIIALEMSLLAICFSLFYRKGYRKVAIVQFVIGNGVAAPLPFIPILGMGFYYSMLFPLIIASILNVSISCLVIERYRRKI